VLISAIVDACFRLIVDGESVAVAALGKRAGTGVAELIIHDPPEAACRGECVWERAVQL
jgi:hypothetical protein